MLRTYPTSNGRLRSKHVHGCTPAGSGAHTHGCGALQTPTPAPVPNFIPSQIPHPCYGGYPWRIPVHTHHPRVSISTHGCGFTPTDPVQTCQKPVLEPTSGTIYPVMAYVIHLVYVPIWYVRCIWGVDGVLHTPKVSVWRILCPRSGKNSNIWPKTDLLVRLGGGCGQVTCRYP